MRVAELATRQADSELDVLRMRAQMVEAANRSRSRSNIYIFDLSIHLSFYLSIFLSNYLCIYLSTSIYVAIYLSIYLYSSLSLFLFLPLYIHTVTRILPVTAVMF